MSDGPTDVRIKEIVQETVHETLLALGMNIDDPVALQKDIHFLREWRESTDSIRKKGVLITVGLVVSGALSLLWIGFKSTLHLS